MCEHSTTGEHGRAENPGGPGAAPQDQRLGTAGRGGGRGAADGQAGRAPGGHDATTGRAGAEAPALTTRNPGGEMGELDEMRAEIELLAGQVTTLGARISELESAPAAATGAKADRTPSRRQLMRLGGAALLGAGAAAVGGVVPAAAVTGGNVVLGNINDAGATTALGATAATDPEPLLFVHAQGAATTPSATGAALVVHGSPNANSDGISSLAATAATGIGVHGVADAGYGVVGTTVTGIELAALGQGRIMQVANTTTGAPPFTPNQHELVRDGTGAVFASRAAGAGAAAWKRMNTLRVDNPSGDGTPFAPARVINTDTAVGPIVGGITGPLMQGQTYTWTIAGTGGIPLDAIGFMGNIVAVAYTSGGFLTIFPAGTTRPVVSSLNFAQAGTVFAWGNSFLVGFGVGANAGKISIFIGLNAGTDTTHVVVDVFAFMQ